MCATSLRAASVLATGSRRSARNQIARNGGGSRHNRSPVNNRSDAVAVVVAASERPNRPSAATAAPWL